MTDPSYESMVLRELEQVRKEIAEVRADVVGARIDIATLKVKSGLWGAGAGFIPAAVVAVMALTTGGS